MRKYMILPLAIAAAFCGSANAAKISFEKSKFTLSRGITVEFDETEKPIESVRVYLAGQETYNGKCIPAKKYVYGMKRINEGTNTQTNTTTLQGTAKGGSISHSRQNSLSQNTKEYYQYFFTDTRLRYVKYNVVYKSKGKDISLGWHPDDGGGCTYNVF